MNKEKTQDAPQSLPCEQLNSAVCAMIESRMTRDQATQALERIYLVQMLKQCRGNQCKAARQAGVHRNTLSRAIKEYQLDMDKISQISGGRKPSHSASSMDKTRRNNVA
jgi:Fis family transcriptional regulator